jgi:hypothetical protein
MMFYAVDAPHCSPCLKTFTVAVSILLLCIAAILVRGQTAAAPTHKLFVHPDLPHSIRQQQG